MLEYYLCIASKFPQLRVYKTFIDMEGRDCMDLNIIVFIILLHYYLKFITKDISCTILHIKH